MIFGVYLVSNIGNPSRLTLNESLISGLVGEVMFAVAIRYSMELVLIS